MAHVRAAVFSPVWSCSSKALKAILSRSTKQAARWSSRPDSPYSSHKATYIHNLFQNGAATLSGVVEMFWERKRRGELDDYGLKDDFTFVMITGDGGMDIGMGPAIGSALRNHKMIILEYDNEGYMNTGAQLSYSTPLGHRTSTSNVGKHQGGKLFHHKDTAQIMAATNIPYVFTGSESLPQDLLRKGGQSAVLCAKCRSCLRQDSHLLSAQLAVGGEDRADIN